MSGPSWFARWFTRTPAKPVPVAAVAPDEPAGGTPATNDPARALLHLPREVAAVRALEMLAQGLGGTGAQTALAVLRNAARGTELPARVRIAMADVFVANDDVTAARTVLAPMRGQGGTDALDALDRLAELARAAGETPVLTELYDEILAIDLERPGVRSRRERLGAPVSAGESGATLIAPEAARLAGGRLVLVRELGRGSAGAVYLAHDRRTDRAVALKIYHPGRRAEQASRLRAEGQVAAAVASRHVVRVHELLVELGAVVMEHCAGGSLRTRLTRESFDDAAIARIVNGIAHALAATHAGLWVHRDLKPGNVLLRADGEVALADYGLARRTGTVVQPFEGTPGYVPPEVATDRVADPRADVYAFGAIVQDLVAERPSLARFRSLAAAARSPDRTARPVDGAALVTALARLG